MKRSVVYYIILAFFIFSCSDIEESKIEDQYDAAVGLYLGKDYEGVIPKLDVILNDPEKENSDLLLKALYLRGFSYYLLDKNKLAYKDYIEALEMADALGDQKMTSRFNNEIGRIFLESELYDQALSHFELALSQSDESTFQERAYYNYHIGKSLRGLGKLDEAMDFYLTAIEMNDQLRNFRSLANSYLEIGLIQQKVGNSDLAISHFEYVVEIAPQTNTPDLFLWKAYNNIGNTHLIAGNLSSAENYFIRSLEYENDDSQLSVTYNNLGKINNKRGDYRKAWQYFKESLAYNSKKVEINELAITNEALKNTFQELNQPDSLLHYTMLINDMALPALQTKSWLKDEEEKIALLTKYQDYERMKAEREQYAKTSWLMAFIMTFLFVSGVLSMRLWKIYNYKSPQKAHSLIKNSNEMVYLLDLLKKEKEEMKKVMDQKFGS